MSEWWDGVATEFVTHYYTQFDASAEARTGLANLYVRLEALFAVLHACFHSSEGPCIFWERLEGGALGLKEAGGDAKLANVFVLILGV